ncbi:MAG TPA: hypothetical protein VF240_20250 [Pyrinomonadaceae bacterium]
MRSAVFEKAKHHLPALGALSLLHWAVFARLIFLSPERVPYATVPFDFAAAYAPWLIFIGDSFRAGIFPLWSPYVSAGTPFFINPQSQLYSPLTLLIASTIGYTQRVAQLQTVLMLLAGGVGAYFLAHAIWRWRAAALVTAVCFTFSSAVFPNLEHMTITNACALTPWAFWAATMAGREARPWAYPVLAFLVYFLITSGYPAVVLMTLLWLLAYTLYLIHLRGGTRRERLRHTLSHAFAWALGLGLAGAHWIPIAAGRREFTRGAPLPLDQALLGGHVYFKYLWGTVFQFLATHSLAGDNSDISMRGLYVGAVALPLAGAALLLSKEHITRPLLLLTVGAFLMACGGMFFGRVFLHILVPALNVSRFPSADSRALMALGLALLAGGGAALLADGHPRARRVVARGCVLLLGVFTLGLFAFRAVLDAAVYDNIAVNYITAEFLFVGLALLALRSSTRRALMLTLVAALALEVGTSVLTNMKMVGDPVEEAGSYRALWASRRAPFDPRLADATRRAGGTDLVSEESGQGYVQKIFYLTDYNPLRLRRFDSLISAGFTDWLTNGKRVVALPPDSRPGGYDSFQQLARPASYTILEFTPNRVVYQVNAEADTLLVFNEVYFPGWRAEVEGRAQGMIDFGGLRALRVAAGEHVINTSFRPGTFYWGLGVSLASLLVFLTWLILLARRHRRARARARLETAGVAV